AVARIAEAAERLVEAIEHELAADLEVVRAAPVVLEVAERGVGLRAPPPVVDAEDAARDEVGADVLDARRAALVVAVPERFHRPAAHGEEDAVRQRAVVLA